MIPIAKPMTGDKEIEAVTEVLRSGMLAQGKNVARFEEDFAGYCGVAEAVAVNNGTAALHATLLALGIQAGDEVIVPDFTFFATASSVCMCGARPVFADVDGKTFNVNPASVQENIGPKTRAVIGVHLFGQPFEVRPVRELCEDAKIPLIEDAAQAHGAAYQKKKAGGLGDVACFSFYPTKNMTAGDGGMVTTDDRDLAAKIRVIINHGQSGKYLHTCLGYNYRMTDIAGALGRGTVDKAGYVQFPEERDCSLLLVKYRGTRNHGAGRAAVGHPRVSPVCPQDYRKLRYGPECTFCAPFRAWHR